MNAALCQYAGECHGGSLPFTGLDVGLIIVIAVVCIATALIIKWLR